MIYIFSAQRYTDFLKRTNHSTTFLKIIWNRRGEGEESEINLIEISFLEGKGRSQKLISLKLVSGNNITHIIRLRFRISDNISELRLPLKINFNEIIPDPPAGVLSLWFS